MLNIVVEFIWVSRRLKFADMVDVLADLFSKLRDELLNGEIFYTLEEARAWLMDLACRKAECD